MKVKVVAKDIGMPSRKVRRVVDMVRGKKVEEALAVLQFMPSPAARAVAKVVKSRGQCGEQLPDSRAVAPHRGHLC